MRCDSLHIKFSMSVQLVSVNLVGNDILGKKLSELLFRPPKCKSISLSFVSLAVGDIHISMIMIGLIHGVVIFIFHFPGHVQQHM